MSSLMLAAFACAQASPDPTSSTMIATSTASLNTEGIKPDADPSAEAAITVDPASLLPDLPRLPRANATLIGGTIAHLDRVRDQITLSVFGGGRTTVLFDPRTRILRGASEATLADLREGERVYLDTILDGSTVFARSIRLSTSGASGESQGIVLKYREERGELTIRDGISPQPVRIRLTSATRFRQGEQTVSAGALQSGSLIAVTFSAEGHGHDVAREVSILAAPGTRFTFTGQVVHIDLRSGLLVLNSSTDHKTYEVYLDPLVTPDDNLHPGTDVTVVATFEDSRYVARNLTIDPQNK